MEEERCFNNWDLDAVVRLGCRRRLSPPRQPDPFASFLPPPPPLPPPQKEKRKEPEPEAEPFPGWRFPDLGGAGGDELLRALLVAPPPLPPPQPLPTPTPTPPPPPPPQQQHRQPAVAAADVALPQARPAPARAQPSGRQAPGGVPRSKRRKNQVKKVVCHVPADGSSSDVWAWRKYGQKPIKGSPYPRGYYRCSSSKGCAARKQVERSRADPGTFILTYTGEHNHAAPTHRNSLAGTTRHKFPSSSSSSAAAPQPPPPSVVVGAGDAQHQHQHQQPSPTSTSTAGLSPTTPLRTPSMEEDDDEEEDELLVEDMEMAGEDELLFLNADADAGAPVSSLFDAVDEPFLSAPWVTSTSSAGEPASAGS